MISARRTQVTMVQLNLMPEHAVAVGHMLGMYAIEARNGKYGHGTSVDEDIQLAEEVKDALVKAAGLKL